MRRYVIRFNPSPLPSHIERTPLIATSWEQTLFGISEQYFSSLIKNSDRQNQIGTRTSFNKTAIPIKTDS